MAAEVENLGLKMSILLSNLNGVLVHARNITTTTVRSGVRTLPDPKCNSKCPLVRYYRCAIVHILILICYQVNTVSIAENNTDTFNLQTILCREQEFVIF